MFTLGFDRFQRRASPSVLKMVIAINIMMRTINNNHFIEDLRVNKLNTNATPNGKATNPIKLNQIKSNVAPC